MYEKWLATKNIVFVFFWSKSVLDMNGHTDYNKKNICPTFVSFVPNLFNALIFIQININWKSIKKMEISQKMHQKLKIYWKISFGLMVLDIGLIFFDM